MPADRRGKAIFQNPLGVQRPRTRAFVKQHRLSLCDPSSSDDRAEHAQAVPQRQRRQSTEASHVRSAVGETAESLSGQRTRHSARAFAHRVSSEVTTSHRREAARAPEHGESSQAKPAAESPVSAWLHRVYTGEFDAPDTVDPFPTHSTISSTSSAWEVASMNSSSSLNASESTTDNALGTEASTIKKAKISYRELLEFRGIADEPSQDDRFSSLRLDTIADDVEIDLDLESLRSIQSVLRKHDRQIEKAIKERSFRKNMHLYEGLKEDVEDWNPKEDSYRRFPAMTRGRFSFDRDHCLLSSEADFQRTLMIAMIDRFDFRETFTYSCEEQWSLEKDCLLSPLGSPNKIPQPKPDLAISFQRSALRPVMMPYPIQLSRCLHPGKRGDKRWFPFFFMEAKRADHTLEEAQQRNLHSASQALSNIYQWMKMDEDLRTDFFDNVRVFTIALNVETFRLRVHRAEKPLAKGSTQDSRLFFHFQEVVTINGYDRVKVCNVIKTILLDYGEASLLPSLKVAFQRIAQRELDHGKLKKRKQNELGRSNPELVDAEIDDQADLTPTTSFATQQPANTGVSFGTEAMQLEPQPKLQPQPPDQVQSRKRGRVGGKAKTK